MAKTPVISAQQKWEYLYFTRKSEAAMFQELNVVGQEGWELVNTHYFKDPKGVMTWLAFLKRPLGGESGEPAKKSQAVPAATVEEKKAENSLGGFDLNGDVFEIKQE